MIKQNSSFAGRKSPYKHGFLPKIAYHMAANNPEKVSYFTKRQVQVYGPITSEDLEFCVKEMHKMLRIWEMEMKEFNSHLG